MKEKRLHIQVISYSNGILRHDKFANYANCISNLFTFHLSPVLIKTTRKLLIKYLKEEDSEYIFPDGAGNDIYTIQQTFPFNEFGNCLPPDKLRLLGGNVSKCLSKLYAHLGLDANEVNIAYKLITDNDFKLSISLCKGIKINRKRTLKALLTAEHFLDYALIQITFLDNNNKLVNKIDLFKTAPAFFIYTQLIKKAKWINDEVFTILNNSGEFAINMQISGLYTITYNPIERDIEGIKEEIRFLAKEFMIEI